MIGVGYDAEPSRDASRAPAINDCLALTKIFRAFVFADHCIEISSRGNFPEQWARGLGASGVEAERFVNRRSDQRSEIEQAGNCIRLNYDIAPQRNIVCLAVGCQHAIGDITSGGMAAVNKR